MGIALAPRGLSPEMLCKDCDIYTTRLWVAEALNEIYGTFGSWDFTECYKSCEHKFKLRRDYDRVKLRNYYWRKKLGR